MYSVSSDWEDYAKSRARKWVSWSLAWIDLKKNPKLIIFYEDMVRNLKTTLNKMCDFLEMKHVCNKDRIECVIQNSEGKYKRKKLVNSTFDPYNEDINIMLNSYIKVIKTKLLRTMNIDAPWELREV